MTLRATIAPLVLSIASLLVIGIGPGRAGDEPKPPAEPGGTAGAAKPEADRARLEKEFAETLTGGTMVGRWCLVRDGKLGEEKEEKYTIASAVKLAGDSWVISARVQFGDKDVTIPVPVKVLWAGDTPVITVTDMGLPGLGSYTARVMVYRGLYSGTWFGRGHGGLLSGKIEKTVEKPAEKAPEKPGEKPRSLSP